MRVKTQPSVEEAEDKLSGLSFGKEEYKEAMEILYEKGYVVRGVMLKRSSVPNFPMGVPLEIMVDWEPLLENSDMILKLRRKDEIRS